MSTSRLARYRIVAVTAALTVLTTLFPAVGSAAVAESCPAFLPSSGYTDLAGLTAETIDAIDCLTWYGISQGVGTHRYDPYGDVPRWQMAIFLARIADDLGINLPPFTHNRFVDVAGYPDEAVRAINQLADLGITEGINARLYDPEGPVTRWQMALFLTRMHQAAGMALPSGLTGPFLDIQLLPAQVQAAINQLVQLGLTFGTTPRTFAPNLVVARWQMALFLTRHLRIRGATPYRIGVVAEPSTAAIGAQVLVTVTVTTPSGVPVVGRRVDVFVGSLDSKGHCVLDSQAVLGGSDAGTSTNCTLDSSDPKTDSSGRVRLVLQHGATVVTDQIFAWIGDLNEVFGPGVPEGLGTTTVVWTAAPASIVMKSQTVRFGTTATIDGWLATAAGAPVPVAGNTIVLTIKRSGTPIVSQVLKTAADGHFRFSYTGPLDPSVGPDAAVVDTVQAFWDKDGDLKDDGAAEFDTTATITWDDDDPKADTAVLAQASVATAVGSSTVITATVADKFGVGYPGAKVAFVVTGANPSVQQVTANASGVATLTYVASVDGVDVIDASVDIDGDTVTDIAQAAVADVTHYQWVEAPSLAGTHTFDPITCDISARTIVVLDLGTSDVLRLRWDSTADTFTVNSVPVSISAFQTALAGLSLPAIGNAVELKTIPYSATESGASSFVLTTG